MEFITISAKTVDEAVNEALISLQVTSDKIEYEVVDKGSSGFLGFGARNAVIRARVKEDSDASSTASTEKTAEQLEKAVMKPDKFTAKPEKSVAKPEMDSNISSERIDSTQRVDSTQPEGAEKQTKQPVKESAPRIPVEPEKVKAEALAFLRDIFKAMNLEAEVEAVFEEEARELDLTISGNEMGVLIGKRGQTLDSLQYLVSLVINKKNYEYVRVKLDTENYRQRRRETLETLARNIAYKVKNSRRPIDLEPMNPYERRIIHSALQNDRYVTTKSEGEDPYRHVVIVPKRSDRRDRPERGDRPGRSRYGRSGRPDRQPGERKRTWNDVSEISPAGETVRERTAEANSAEEKPVEIPKWKRDLEKYRNSTKTGE